MMTDPATKLQSIETKVQELKTRLNREMTLTTLLGALMLAAFCGYFWYGYNQIAELLQPKMLVGLAGTMANDRLPDIRKQLEEEVKKNAPVWAEELSRQAIASVPTLRQNLEEYIVNEVDSVALQTVQAASPEIQNFVESNKVEISQAIKELKQSDALSEETLASIETALRNTLQVDIKAQAAEAVKTMDEIAAKAEYLKKGEKLADIDQKLREIVMILRRLHLREQSRG
jgi:hypothetical protein